MLLARISSLLLLTLACGSPDTPVRPPGDTLLDPCAGLAGARFESLEELETGFAPEGAALGHWSVEFSGDTFVYTKSDMVMVGEYTCRDRVLDARSGSRSFAGRIDPGSGRLTWDSRAFERVP